MLVCEDKMGKNRCDIEAFTKALEILDDYECYQKNGILFDLHEMQAIISIVNGNNKLMGVIKDYVVKVDCPAEKQKLIDAFRVISAISFNKLEQDVMGVN
jgi:hypothetical protein